MAIWISIGFEYENIAYHEWIEVVSDPFLSYKYIDQEKSLNSRVDLLFSCSN